MGNDGAGARARCSAPISTVCDATGSNFPKSSLPYKRTPEFDETSVPAGLRREHSTKAGVWAKIVVVDGRLRYCVDALNADVELSRDRAGIVVPEVLHHVEPLGAVRFYVEFYRAP